MYFCYNDLNEKKQRKRNPMSLLADLLSKIKQPQAKREVPPNLKNIVQNASLKSTNKRKIILLSVLFIVSVSMGIALVYFTGTLTNKSVSPAPLTTQETMQPPAPAVLAEKEEVKSSSSESSAAKEAEPVPPTPVKKKSSRAAPKQKEKSPEAPTHPVTASKVREMLPKLEQVIVKKESSGQFPSRPVDESVQDAYLYSAGELEIKNDYQGALINYKKALEIDSNNYVIMNNIAYIYLHLGLIEESVNYSQRALEINKEYIPALTNMGIASAKSENFSAAEGYFHQALKFDPHNSKALLNLAILYEQQMDYARALDHFSRLAKTGDSSGVLGSARIYEKQGKTEEALTMYKNAYANNSLDNKARSEIRQRIQMLQNKK